MARFWGLSTNRDQLLECALAPYARELDLRTGDTGGWGLAYYSGGDLLQCVTPQAKGAPLAAAEMVRGIRADIVMMHTRTATVGPDRRENIHPFRFKEWAFAHNGTILGFSSFKDKLMQAIPAFIQRNIRGDTDSEHAFHLFLSFLFDSGQLGRPDVGIAAIRDALTRALSMIDQLAKGACEPPSPASVLVSDGYSLVAASRGIPVDYALVEGLRDCALCRASLRPGETERRTVSHDELRAVIVRSGDLAEPTAGLRRLAQNAVLMVSRTHDVELSSFV